MVSVEETNSELTFSLVRLDTHTIDPKLGSVDFSVLTVAGSANGTCMQAGKYCVVNYVIQMLVEVCS